MCLRWLTEAETFAVALVQHLSLPIRNIANTDDIMRNHVQDSSSSQVYTSIQKGKGVKCVYFHIQKGKGVKGVYFHIQKGKGVKGDEIMRNNDAQALAPSSGDFDAESPVTPVIFSRMSSCT